jgi:hypothetical protein
MFGVEAVSPARPGRNNLALRSAPWNARAIDRCAQRRESRGVVVLLALIALGVAFADVPAQYRGLWCDGSKGYYRCREATSEGYLHIRRDRINLSEEGDCRITAVTPSAKGHRLRVYCPAAGLPDPPEHVNLRLDARGRLHLE